MRTCHVDQQKAPWFENDFCLSCASYIATLWTVISWPFFVKFCRNLAWNSTFSIFILLSLWHLTVAVWSQVKLFEITLLTSCLLVVPVFVFLAHWAGRTRVFFFFSLERCGGWVWAESIWFTAAERPAAPLCLFKLTLLLLSQLRHSAIACVHPRPEGSGHRYRSLIKLSASGLLFRQMTFMY